jgi:aryl-alcohol dehydrogenase-like predicted oxidoreductase
MQPEHRELGSSGLSTSRIGLGTWAIGGTGWGGTNERDAVDAIRASLDEGITLIDTAPIYGFGLSEELVGKAIAGRRDEVVLASKCGLVWNEPRGDFFFDSNHGPVHRYLGPQSIRREVEETLRRLRTDRIDLYQTHWQETTTPIPDIMATLLDLRREGKLRVIGVSNANSSQLRQYMQHGPVGTAQEVFNMIDREHATSYLPWCLSVGVGVIVYSPLAMGLLTGKCTSQRTFSEGDVRQGNRRFTGDSVEHVREFLTHIQPVAKAHGITIAQLVIAWTLQQPFVSHVLCGARNPRQAKENAAAARVDLSGQEVDFVNERINASNLQVPKIYD